MVAVLLAVSSNGALISVYNIYVRILPTQKKAIDIKLRICHYPSSITGADAMQTNEINSPEIKNHKIIIKKRMVEPQVGWRSLTD